MVLEVAPGYSVELRIPPYSVIQCVFGKVHKRVSSPNFVEMSGHTLNELVGNPYNWEDFRYAGRISDSGTNKNLKDLFKQLSKLVVSTR